MRVLNDREEKTEPSELGFLSVAAHAMLAAVGIATVVFGPLPMIIGHIRLSEPWSKIAAILGAVIALVFLDIPMPLVLVVFIFSLYVADAVSREVDFWTLVRNATFLGAILGLGALLIGAQADKIELGHYWTSLVDAWMGQLQKAMHAEKNFQWEVLRGIFLYEGPFLYLSGLILSLWLSIGIAAHMAWIPEGHHFGGASLRRYSYADWDELCFHAALHWGIFRYPASPAYFWRRFSVGWRRHVHPRLRQPFRAARSANGAGEIADFDLFGGYFTRVLCSDGHGSDQPLAFSEKRKIGGSVMKVILREDVVHLGSAGTIVNVSNGFARNYLIPRNFAIPATSNNLKQFDHEKRVLESKRAKRKKEAETLKNKLERISCSISKKVGEQDKLFGSVTTMDIEKAFNAEGFTIDKKDILLTEPIKSLGVYTIPVRVFEDVVANTKVWVVRE